MKTFPTEKQKGQVCNMKKTLVIMILITIVVFLAACGGFNTKTAEEDSRKALDNFFSSHNELETLVETSDVNEVSNFVEKEFESNFTQEFMSIIQDKIMANENTQSKYLEPELFFLKENYDVETKEMSTVFFNQYDLMYDSVDSERLTVTYKLTPTFTDLGKHGGLLEMVLQKDGWKIHSFQQ